MEQLVPCKLVTVKSCSKTNCTEPVTNGLKLNKERCHWPTWTTWQKLTHKTHSLTFYTQIGNTTQQPNTHPQSKSSLSCNCRTKRHQSKRVTSQQNEKKYTRPNNCCFSLNIGKCPPGRRQTICGKRNTIGLSRTSTLLTPFQMNTFQSLSIPKTTYRFTKSRQCTISCLCTRMVQRMIYNQYQHCNCYCYSPNIKAKHSSHKRQVQTYQRYTLPCFCCRSNNPRRIIKLKVILNHSFFDLIFLSSIYI